MVNFTRELESLKIGILMESFNLKLKKYELKIHRGVICHGNEEWHKIWGGTDLSIQSWHEEFDKFWPEHLKASKIFTLMGSFWAKYILLELKKYRGIIFHETEEGHKIWRGIDLSFQNWHKEFDKFWREHRKVSKNFTVTGSFWEKYILLELKKCRGVVSHDIEEWCKIWQVFSRALESAKIGTLMGSFLYELKIYREVMCHGNEEWYKNWRRTDLSFQNWHKELQKFWTEHSKV